MTTQALTVSVIGEAGVGKTALITQFVSSQFVSDYNPTIEETYKKQFVVDKSPVLLDINDSAGQLEYSSTRDQYLSTGDGYLLVYDVTNLESYRSMLKFHDQILKSRNVSRFPLVLVANKCDMEQSKRSVTSQEGRELANQMICTFFETSALSKQNVENAFLELIREIRRSREAQSVTFSGESNRNSSGGGSGGGSSRKSATLKMESKKEKADQKNDRKSASLRKDRDQKKSSDDDDVDPKKCVIQ